MSLVGLNQIFIVKVKNQDNHRANLFILAAQTGCSLFSNI